MLRALETVQDKHCESSITSISLTEISFCDLTNFMSSDRPLGSMGSIITSLKFNTCPEVKQVAQCAQGVSSAAATAAQSWLFFRAVSKLPKLSSLCVPKQFWDDLTRTGRDVAEPLDKLQGLVVKDVVSGAVIARVQGGRLMVPKKGAGNKKMKVELPTSLPLPARKLRRTRVEHIMECLSRSS